VAIQKLNEETFRRLRDFIYEKSGIYFQEHKLYLLESRLGRRLRALGIDDFESYFMQLRRMPNQQAELIEIFNEITINETFFYRFPKQLDTFSQKLLPALMAKREAAGQRQIRFWSVASSSGEELYTLGMILLETVPAKLATWKFDILGTDISMKILEKAKEGLYTSNSFRNTLPDGWQRKYFTQQGVNYRINDSIKKMVRFDHANLTDFNKVRAMRGVDFIFCRNVLIYFDLEIKKQVIRNLYGVLNHGGYLFLGESESLHGISSAFKVEHFPGVFVYRKE
jgi:chemotaxis protein methyltransferase CheR